MKKINIFVITLILLLWLAAPSRAVLIDRGGGLIYDTDLNITWLQDANLAKTSGLSLGGWMTWSEAMDWASNLDYAGYSDWRLPTTAQPDPNCTWSNGYGDYGYNCTGSEMGHLYYTELGNKGGWYPGTTVEQPGWGLNNKGPFSSNLFSSYNLYWTSTDVPNNNGGAAFEFGVYAGDTTGDAKGHGAHAWAVRDGDSSAPASAPVPEPSTCILLGSGLIGLVGVKRRFMAKG